MMNNLFLRSFEVKDLSSVLSSNSIRECKWEFSQTIALPFWTQEVNWMYMRRSEDLLCTFHLCLVSEGANMYVFRWVGVVMKNKE